MVDASNLYLRLLLLSTALFGLCSAFVPLNHHVIIHQPSTATTRETTTSVFLAKKKRRRRKDGNSDQSAPPPSPAVGGSGELPDFELAEEQDAPPARKKISTNLDEITPAMMGGSSQSAKSVSELIQDRSLEATFEFDDAGDQSLPDLAELAKQSDVTRTDDSRPRGTLRSYSKDTARGAADENSNPLEKIPFLTDESGKVSFVKVLEAGAWLGIFLLVGWELYLNSPFFDRAAPMAPVVYELYM